MRHAGLVLAIVFLLCPPVSAQLAAPHVVFVTGDCEYRSEITMPAIAKILETRHGMRTSVCYAVNKETGERETKHLKNIEGLEALATADLAVFFIRYRQLPDDQLKRILAYADSGKPMVGLRVTTHAFRYENAPQNEWNDGFGQNYFGQKWIKHHGHDSSTNVYLTIADHPITRGVANSFHCRSWLYEVKPLPKNCTPLLVGAAVKGEKPTGEIFGEPNPVAWTRDENNHRVFFTTLGHPQDFVEVSARRLLIQGIFWALTREQEIPEEGLNVDWVDPYDPPETTQALRDPLERIALSR